MKPKLSILLPAMLGYETVLAALESWEMQTCRDQLEILILCPDPLGPAPAQTAPLPPGQILVPVGSANIHEARVIGIQQASADYVMLAEDHCLPDPDWTQAILDRLEEGWDAVGPALRPGDRTSSWAQGAFLIGYGEWMTPVAGGPTGVICGWNGTILTQAIRQLGSELTVQMLVGAFMVRALHERGHRFYLEDRARMRHFDDPVWTHEILMLAAVGLGFGSMRTRHWFLTARLLYLFAAPAIAFLHWKRAIVNYRRAGAGSGLRFTALATALVLACVWGLGEVVGALMGTARVGPHIWRSEVKPVRREAVSHSTAQEQHASPNLMPGWTSGPYGIRGMR